MFLDPFHRDEYLLIGLNRAIALHGVAGLTVRRVAEELDMAPSTLLHHYGSREGVLVVGAREMRRARRSWIGSRVFLHGPCGFLPDSGELALLADCLGHRLGREELRHVQALVDGLYAAIAEPVSPLRRRTAVAILTADLRRLGVTDPLWVDVA